MLYGLCEYVKEDQKHSNKSNRADVCGLRVNIFNIRLKYTSAKELEDPNKKCEFAKFIDHIPYVYVSSLANYQKIH